MDHVAAEVLAFPLASERALQLGDVKLCPNLQGSTGDLWRGAENYLTVRYPGLSIDELVHLRDLLWFSGDNSRRKICLGTWLRERVAEHYLRRRGDHVVPCLQGEDDTSTFGPEYVTKVRSRVAWRWMSFALPPDLLLSAMSNNGSVPAKIDLMSPRLSQSLQMFGFAETHQHVGAGLSFREMWAATLRRLLPDSTTTTVDFSSPGADLKEGRLFALWLLRAAVARNLLARFLFHRRAPSPSTEKRSYAAAPPFNAWYESAMKQDSIDRTRSATIQDADSVADSEPERRQEKFECSNELRITLDRLIRDFAESNSNDERATDRKEQWFNNQTAYLQTCPTTYVDRMLVPDVAGHSVKDQIEAIHTSDPISDWFPPILTGVIAPVISSEMRFVAAALEYVQHGNALGNVDREFCELFFQVLRVRCLYYRHLTQRPLTPGLQWFIRNYGRMSPGKTRELRRVLPVCGAVSSGFGYGLRSYEFRFSPWKDCGNGELREFVCGVDSTMQQFGTVHSAEKSPTNGGTASSGTSVSDSVCRDSADMDFEYGIVMHLTRARGGGAKSGRPRAFREYSNADPNCVDDKPGDVERPNVHGYRYSAYYAETRFLAEAIAHLLLELPLSLSVIRGIDVCSDEVGVPDWVIRPLVNYIRRASMIASEWIANQQLSFQLPPIKTTVHAGEDFVHLLGGLRRVEQSIRHLGLREGDRIGHGISLGVDAVAWAQSAGRVALPREERLLDLVWEWSMYSRHGMQLKVNRHAFLLREIERLSHHLFGRVCSPLEVEYLVTDLHSDTFIEGTGFPGVDNFPSRQSRQPEHPQSDQHQLLMRYLTDSEVFQRGQELEWVDPINEGDSMASLQGLLRDQICDSGIVIEVNPSSNLLIANLGDLMSHPLWRLRPPVVFSPSPAVNPESGDQSYVSSPLDWNRDEIDRQTRFRGPFRAPSPTGRPLCLCIGSDDPLTFATDLRNEYQLVMDSLVSNGLSVEQASAWVHDVRRAGLESRFTLCRPKNMPPISKLIGDIPRTELPVI